jgi:hypothetical protein
MKQHKQNKVHKQNNINFVLFLSRIFDLTITFSITLLTNLLLLHWLFIKPIYIFIFITISYYLISYIFFRKTFGKFFYGISITLKSDKTISLKTILKRELLFKYVFFSVIPILLMIFLGWNDVGVILTYIVILNFIISIIYYFIKRELWWNSFAKTKYIKGCSSTKNMLKKYLGFITFVSLVYVFLLVNNNSNNNTQQSFLGFNYPFKKNEYPINEQVRPYINFLSVNKLQSAKNYILSLFEKNDIVVLSEANHLESTQWEMIYSLVSDSVFVNRVGNIFTEYGNVKNQPKVDNFLHTKFDNNTSRYKSAATLMSYKSGGFYRFMNKLNTLNESLSDSLKLNLFFTDIMPWSYLIYDLPPVVQLEKRDSLMASIVIEWYKSNKKKCLVVTNYRHAFILNKEKEEQESSIFNKNILKTHFGGNEAQYIFNLFPNKTVNVMIYGDAYNFLFLPVPIQNGKWKTALSSFASPVGFNFESSPFGQDMFDFYPMKGRSINVKYKDVFYGFVYYSSKENLKFSSQLYRKYAAQKEYDEIINNVNIDKVTLTERMKNIDDYKQNNNNVLLDIYLNWYYYIDIILFIILTLSSLLILIIDFLIRVFARHRIRSKLSCQHAI